MTSAAKTCLHLYTHVEYGLDVHMQLPNMPFSFSDVGEGPAKRSRESEQMVSRTASVVQQFHNFGLDDRQSESASWVNSRSESRVLTLSTCPFSKVRVWNWVANNFK